MPTYTSDNFNFCANARVRVSKTGVAVPSALGPKTVFPADFVELGFLDEKGIVIDDARTMSDVKSLQSFYATMKLVSDRKHSLQFNLQEWSAASVQLAFGGGQIRKVGDVFRYDPPDPSFIDTRQLVLDWSVNGNDWRWVIYRGIVSSNVQTTLAKTAEALLPITFEALGTSQMGGATALPWNLFTTDPALDPEASTAPAGTTTDATGSTVPATGTSTPGTGTTGTGTTTTP